MGIFLFGVGMIFVGDGIPLGEITYEHNGYFYGIPYWVIPALTSFLLAGVLLAWSFTEGQQGNVLEMREGSTSPLSFLYGRTKVTEDIHLIMKIPL